MLPIETLPHSRLLSHAKSMVEHYEKLLADNAPFLQEISLFEAWETVPVEITLLKAKDFPDINQTLMVRCPTGRFFDVRVHSLKPRYHAMPRYWVTNEAKYETRLLNWRLEVKRLESEK